MSLILSIETSTTVCSVALYEAGHLLVLEELNKEATHAEVITIMIASAIKKAGFKNSDLKAVAISMGPGSYTGLRIGTSTAKGLCFALDIPLIAVPTLQAMALEVNKDNNSKNLLCPMIDARRMEVFTAIFDSELQQVKETSAEILTVESFSELLNNNTILFFGNGSPKFSSILKNNNAIFLENINPSAKNVGELAYKKFRENLFEDLVYFEPYYLKDFMSNQKLPKTVL